jgi:hypothetical protein
MSCTAISNPKARFDSMWMVNFSDGELSDDGMAWGDFHFLSRPDLHALMLEEISYLHSLFH